MWRKRKERSKWNVMKKGILLFFVFFLRKGFYWICLFVTYSFVFNSRGSTLFLLVMSFIVDSVLSEIPTFSLYVGDGGSGEGPSQRPLIDLNSPPAPEPEPALHSLHWELSEGEKEAQEAREREEDRRTHDEMEEDLRLCQGKGEFAHLRPEERLQMVLARRDRVDQELAEAKRELTQSEQMLAELKEQARNRYENESPWEQEQRRMEMESRRNLSRLCVQKAFLEQERRRLEMEGRQDLSRLFLPQLDFIQLRINRMRSFMEKFFGDDPSGEP